MVTHRQPRLVWRFLIGVGVVLGSMIAAPLIAATLGAVLYVILLVLGIELQMTN